MTAGESGSSVASVLAQLEAAIDAAEALPLSCQHPNEVRDWACGMQVIRARAEALACQAAVAVGSVDLPELSGRRSVAAVLGAHAKVNPRSITADVRIGDWLAGYPVFEAAFGQGRITRAHVEALRRRENPRTAVHLVGAQDYLLTAAEGCEWHDFLRVRTASQRRADALAKLITRGAARPNGTYPAPLVHLVIGHQVVAQLLAMIGGDGPGPDELDLAPDDVNRRCELVDGTPVQRPAVLHARWGPGPVSSPRGARRSG